MNLSKREENKILKEITKSQNKKVICRPFLSESDSGLYNVALKKFIKSIGFYCLTEDLVFFKKNNNVFYVLSIIPEVAISIPKIIAYDNYKFTKKLQPEILSINNKVVDLKMNHTMNVQDGPFLKKVQISFQLIGFHYETKKEYSDYATYNYELSTSENPTKMIESSIYEQFLNHYKIVNDLKNDLLSKNVGVYLPELFANWSRSSELIDQEIFVDESFKENQALQKVIEYIRNSQ